jgi:hypothetical protein
MSERACQFSYTIIKGNTQTTKAKGNDNEDSTYDTGIDRGICNSAGGIALREHEIIAWRG